jgi:uncharacterized protein (DUF1501 family)
VEAGVPVVTLTFGSRGGNGDCKFTWDTHEHNFKCLRVLAPALDQAVHALITDLDQRGLLGDVAVVIGGEMGRTPKIGQSTGNGAGKTDGRDHWLKAGFTLLAGGHFQTGQVIGHTDARAERSVGNPYTPQNLLATLYRHLGIDPETTLPDHTGRPIHLLDDGNPIKELL